MQRGPGLRVTVLDPKLRLAAVMWPSATSIITCTRRLDDSARSVGVPGPCRKLEAGEPEPQKVLSWATLGRFDGSAPDAPPPSSGGRCHIELVKGQLGPSARPATATWVTPTRRESLDSWTPGAEPASVDMDAYTIETSLAPEGEWLAILRVAVGLGDGERVVEVARARLLRIPACD